MSFFNLTHTGVQDPFKTASYTKKDGDDGTLTFKLNLILIL